MQSYFQKKGKHIKEKGNKIERFEFTLSPPNKLSSAKLLVCFNFQSAAMSLKVGENVV